MAKITFTRDADYVHNRHKTTAFKAGWSGTVKRDIQQWAVSMGCGFIPQETLAESSPALILTETMED